MRSVLRTITIRSTGEPIVLVLPGGKTKTKKEHPIRTLEKIIILRPHLGIVESWPNRVAFSSRALIQALRA